jgi:hypothetical protein
MYELMPLAPATRRHDVPRRKEPRRKEPRRKEPLACTTPRGTEPLLKRVDPTPEPAEPVVHWPAMVVRVKDKATGRTTYKTVLAPAYFFGL